MFHIFSKKKRINHDYTDDLSEIENELNDVIGEDLPEIEKMIEQVASNKGKKLTRFEKKIIQSFLDLEKFTIGLYLDHMSLLTILQEKGVISYEEYSNKIKSLRNQPDISSMYKENETARNYYLNESDKE